MATPLQLRNRRQQAQSTVRRAINAVNTAMDSWKRAWEGGKQQARELTNAVLNESHLSGLTLGALGDVPGLLPAAAAKLQRQQEQHFLSLQDCLEQLQEAVQGLRSALESIAALVELEAGAALLGEGPVFASLSLPTIRMMLEEVRDMYAAELRVKEAVLTGFWQVPGEFLGRGQPLPGGALAHSGSGGGSGGRIAGGRAQERNEQLKNTMHVYLMAWVLSPELDMLRAEAHVASIKGDMQGF